jgi:Cys-tRNA(Pro)/Cys-tRNA(Cys) deacylase
MSKTTRATQALDAAGVAYSLHAYSLHAYAYDPAADRIGLQAAEAIGAHPSTVLKTLMTEVDGKPVCVVVPSDREVSMKALARAAGGKVAAMVRPAEAERATGFVVGGISPFGQKRRVPTLVEEAALLHPFVYVNAGQRGLQFRLAPADLVAALGAKAAALVA